VEVDDPRLLLTRLTTYAPTNYGLGIPSSLRLTNWTYAPFHPQLDAAELRKPPSPCTTSQYSAMTPSEIQAVPTILRRQQLKDHVEMLG
jgi:hypothetical protein